MCVRERDGGARRRVSRVMDDVRWEEEKEREEREEREGRGKGVVRVYTCARWPFKEGKGTNVHTVLEC